MTHHWGLGGGGLTEAPCIYNVSNACNYCLYSQMPALQQPTQHKLISTVVPNLPYDSLQMEPVSENDGTSLIICDSSHDAKTRI